MCPGGDLDLLGELAVTGDRAVMRSVQPNDLGEHMRVHRIGLRPRRRMPFPIPGHLQRVDREHRVAGREQRLHPRPTIGLDPHQHLIRLGRGVEMLGDQLMQAW